MPALIEARNAFKTFGGGRFGRGSTVALSDFSMNIRSDRPSITAVVGESGSGKTTLARILLGLVTPTEGSVLYNGRDIAGLRAGGRREFLGDVQAIFQDPYGVYNPFYRVDHVLTTPIKRFRLASSKHAARRLIEDALRAVGLQPEEILGRFPHQLSGGQRQRIMVARALLLRPKLIVADEPVSMVDASLRATILGSLKKLNQEVGISILYITHDLATAYQVCDSILVMYRSRVVEAGSVENVVKNPQHPYTQLLISSIPKVSTTRDWIAGDEPRVPAGAVSSGCSFADRCAMVSAICHTAPPPLFRVEAKQAVACYQYRTASVLASGEMDQVITGSVSA